ncbi:hypothetical protein GCM10022226_56980 [Sphaerisporangium flaviroseum]|uniref:DUF4157 domain-containing protein n=1 Tax=Sphaerisporangium flaviroseum TaxID=509199 RepID=A0ABP7IXN7_9ACTN
MSGAFKASASRSAFSVGFKDMCQGEPPLPAVRTVVHEVVHTRDGADGVPLARKPNVVEADGWSEPL